MSETIQTRLSANGELTPEGNYEILAISAGEGNGWEFGEETLRASLSLWEGAECFIDHSFWGHSIRDLAGLTFNPVWDVEKRGIRLSLKCLGPSGPLLAEVGRQILAERDLAPDVGFSADVLFSAKGKMVEKILKVNSIDLVMSPARGGVFLRALNSLTPFGNNGKKTGEKKEMIHLKPRKETISMNQSNSSETPSGLQTAGNHPNPESAALSSGGNDDQTSQSVRLLLDDQGRQAALQEAEKTKAIRIELCSHLLEASLNASRLPSALQEKVRKQFSGRVFSAQELQTAIDDSRTLISELTGGLTVQGPAAVSGMFSTEDQIQMAVEDLFGLPREKGKENVRVARLSGIRELYLMLTGDSELTGGYHANRLMLATTADFSGLVKNAMNKIVVNTWEQLGKAGYLWWEKIATVEHFSSLNPITGTLVGTVGPLPAVAEGEAYNELTIGDSPETASFTKYGGYIPLTLELIDRDLTRKLAAYPRELATAGLRKISALVAAVFTDNAGVGPTMADGGALFNNSAVTSAGGHANLQTTALSPAAWEAVSASVYNQPMLVKNVSGVYGTGPKMAINPRYLLTPRALQLTGMQILYPSLEHSANIYSENQQRGQPGDVITIPDWSDASDWAAVCDPLIAPAIFIGERFGLMPQIFIAGDELSPAVFTHDEHRLKVRHFLSVWVNDFRPLHKNNVAG